MNPNPKPHLSNLQQELMETADMLKHQAALTRGLQRLLWIAAYNAGGSLVLDENLLSPLWEWTPVRDEKEPSKVTIRAEMMPEPTESQIQQLAMRLSGTARHPGDDMVAVGLGDHPFAYINRLLSPFVVLHAGTWIPKADYDALPEDQKTPTPNQP